MKGVYEFSVNFVLDFDIITNITAIIHKYYICNTIIDLKLKW